MALLGQLLLNGLSMGLVYVLLASGFNLILCTSRILFIAYGEFYMLGAFIVWGLIVLFKVPFFVALCLAMLATGILGGIVYRLIFHYIQSKKRQFLAFLIAAVGLMMLMGQGVLLAFGAEARGITSIFPGIVSIGSVSISFERLVLILLALAIALGLFLLLQKTDIGRAIRAISFNAEVAALQGVNSSRTFMTTFVIGCAIAGFAGGIMSSVFPISSEMSNITFLVLLVVMLGGVGSMLGAVVAGLVLGLTLSFGQYYLGGNLAEILFFVIIGILVFFKRGGLLGQSEEEMAV